MTVIITRELVTTTSVDCAFGYLSDYRNVPEWLFGVVRFTPTTRQLTGLGATFDASVSVGITLKSRVTVHEWVDGRVMAFTSVKGFTNSSRWEATETEDGGCRLAVQVAYELPLGPAGKAVGRTIEPFVTAAVTRTTAALKCNLDRLTLSQG